MKLSRCSKSEACGAWLSFRSFSACAPIARTEALRSWHARNKNSLGSLSEVERCAPKPSSSPSMSLRGDTRTPYHIRGGCDVMFRLGAGLVRARALAAGLHHGIRLEANANESATY